MKILYLLLFSLSVLTQQALGQNPQDGWIFNPEQDTYSEDALLDLRFLNEEIAGENGFIQLSADGESFETEDRKPIRFWAIGGGDGTRNMSLEDIKTFGKFLAKKGVNMVRFHGQIHSVSNDINQVNTEEVDAIWKFVAAMKEEGIYSTISPFWPNFIDEIPNSWDLGDYSGTNKKPWGLLYFDETFQDAFKNWLTYLYTEKNPYTGIALKDEPAVGLIQMLNEDGVFFWTIQNVEPSLLNAMENQFHDWLVDKYGNIELAYDAWGSLAPLDTDDPNNGEMGIYIIYEATIPQFGGKDKRLSDQIAFFADTQRNFYQEVYNHLRDIGCKQLINTTNWKTANAGRLLDAERYTNSIGDVMAVNRYYSADHIGENTGWRIQPGDKYVGESVLFQPNKLPVNVKQISGKAFTMTESSWPFPHKYIAESVFLTAAYASLTGFDSYYWFSPRASTEGYSDRLGTFHTFESFDLNFEPIYKFNNATPGHLSPFPANALLYRKGYVQEGDLIVNEVRSMEDIYGREIPLITEESGFDPNRDSYDNQSDPTATEIAPIAYLTGKVRTTYGGDPSSSNVAENLNEFLDFSNKIVKSSTGELVWNYEKGICTLNAPAAQGVTGFFTEGGETVSLKDITLEIKNDYAAISVVSMDEQPLNSSEEVLIQVNTIYETTNYRETPTTFELGDQMVDGFEVLQTGQLPWKAANTVIILTIANSNIKSAHLLDVNGYEIGQIPVEEAANGLKIYLPKNAMYVIANTQPSTVTALQEITEEKLLVYPNPANSSIYLDLKDKAFEFDEISITSMEGKELFNQKINLKDSVSISPKLQPGLYLLKVKRDGNFLGVKKILFDY